jgi:hypothetical protein
MGNPRLSSAAPPSGLPAHGVLQLQLGQKKNLTVSDTASLNCDIWRRQLEPTFWGARAREKKNRLSDRRRFFSKQKNWLGIRPFDGLGRTAFLEFEILNERYMLLLVGILFWLS